MKLNPADTLKIFAAAPNLQSFAAGETIFQEGDTGDVLFGLIEGEVEFTLHGKIIEVLTTGDVFGQGALVHEDHRRESTAIAKTAVKLATIDREHFLFAVQQSPIFALEVLRSYSDRFRHLKNNVF